MQTAILVIALGSLVFLAYGFSTLFKKFNIPDVLPLFLIGLFVGPAMGWVTPAMLGRTGELIATFTLIGVLFVGGLNIHISSLIRSFSKTFLLMFLNLIGTVIIITAGAWYLFDVSLIAGTVVGILLGGTSAGVVIPIVNRLRVRDETRTILSIESDLNDIFSVTVALALIGIMHGDHVDLISLPVDIIIVFIMSVLAGVLIALIWSRILGHIRLVQHNIFTTPALLLIIYGLTQYAGGVGPVTVLAFGITLGNLSSIKLAPMRTFSNLTDFRLTSQERSFFSSLVFLFKTFFFIYIGIVMPLNEPRFLLWGACVMFILYLVRIVIADWLLKDDVPPYDLTVVKSLLPKGLTGGALLVLVGDPLLEKLTYPVILMSIVFTAIMVSVVDLITTPGEDTTPANIRKGEEQIPPRLLPAPDNTNESDPNIQHYSIRHAPSDENT